MSSSTDAAMVSIQKSDALGEVSKQDRIEAPRSGSKKEKKSDPALKTPCFQIKDIEHEGWLTKQGGSGFTPKNWRRRWMVLKEKKLYYYKTSFDISALGVIDLPGYVIEDCLTIRKPNAFMATKSGCRTYYFYADTSEEMIRWIQVLRESSALEKETIRS